MIETGSSGCKKRWNQRTRCWKRRSAYKTIYRCHGSVRGETKTNKSIVRRIKSWRKPKNKGVLGWTGKKFKTERSCTIAVGWNVPNNSELSCAESNYKNYNLALNNLNNKTNLAPVVSVNWNDKTGGQSMYTLYTQFLTQSIKI